MISATAAAVSAAGSRVTVTAHPVDEVLPVGRLIPLGLQHVLIMYAGAIAVPLIVGRALKLPPEQVALLISADLFCCGLVTIIQSLGVTRWFGIKLPVMMGVTFASVTPMLVMAANPALGINGIFGAVIGAGIISIAIAPFVSRLLRLFPPVVTGTIIAVIGISLMRVAVQWAAGGAALQPKIADPAAVGAVSAPLIANPAYASLDHLGIALFVLIAVVLIAKYGRGFLSNIAVLLGIVLGCLVAWPLGKMSFAKVAQAKLFAFITPFQFGWPTFDAVAILTMTLVMIVVMIESTGLWLDAPAHAGHAVLDDVDSFARDRRLREPAQVVRRRLRQHVTPRPLRVQYRWQRQRPPLVAHGARAHTLPQAAQRAANFF